MPTAQQRVAVVTGGASGMGRASALRLARAGHPVAVLDLDADGAERIADQIRATGVPAVAVGVDISDRDGVVAAFDKVRGELGPVAILVASAGMSRMDDFADLAPEVWSRIIDVNLTGTFHCCQTALPDMVAARWGRIITISSSSALRGTPRMAPYAAAKAGVITLMKCLARGYAEYGITVNDIPPSSIETPMMVAQQARGDLPAREVLERAVPLGRLGTPDDIAAAVAFLASEEAGFITGQVLGVNGGTLI
jgi:2-hydroxycyclohexanecarboxyl-CoA dehydrogenase